MGSMFGMSSWMWLPGLVPIGVLFAFGVLVVGRSPHRTRTAIRTLEERFARGEIDAEELERRRATLEGSG
jgi:uncharacterized membrane protein